MNRFQAQRQDKDTTRVNEHIRVPRVRVISGSGESLGIMPTGEALQRALEEKLDLVEVAPNAEPPVCRIMDYGKFKYEKAKKLKEAKKKQHISHLKEIKMHPKIEDHDYNFKLDHARKFLFRGDRVKATIVFRGREIAHLDFGKILLERLKTDLIDLATIELSCKMEGRNMISMFVADKMKIKEFTRKIEQEKKRQESLAKLEVKSEVKPEQA
ncbi:MAG: translation initiation factor IF-3 [Chitinivibrionales bacterium]